MEDDLNQPPAVPAVRQRRQRRQPLDTPLALPDATAAPAVLADRPEETRKPMRVENSRDAAARRTAEILGHLNGDIGSGTDEFYFDVTAIPEGWTYEWKRDKVFNKEDPAYTVALRRMGWEAVPSGRHPDMMPLGTPPGAPIERKGQVLMQRPQEFTDRVVASDLRRARDQVRVKESQLGSAPDGQFGRDHAQVKPKINKSYEAMPIPKE